MSPVDLPTFLRQWSTTRPDLYALVAQLRAAVMHAVPDCHEEVKYGGLLFSAGQPFCGIFMYQSHVSLEFSRGAFLPDHHGLLAGRGRLRRHIKFSSLQDIDTAQLSPLIIQASLPAAATNRASNPA